MVYDGEVDVLPCVEEIWSAALKAVKAQGHLQVLSVETRYDLTKAKLTTAVMQGLVQSSSEETITSIRRKAGNTHATLDMNKQQTDSRSRNSMLSVQITGKMMKASKPSVKILPMMTGYHRYLPDWQLSLLKM